MRVLSMNQFKLRHIKKFEMSNRRMRGRKNHRKDNRVGKEEVIGEDSRRIMAISKRESRQSQINAYLESLNDCDSKISNMRKVHRCWSRKVTCSGITDRDFGILERHSQFQKEAKLIYRKVTYPCNGCYWKYKSEKNVYYSEISSKLKGQKDVTFQSEQEFFAHRKKMGYNPRSGYSDLIVVDG